MSFLAPAWLGTALLGLLAASVPVIIHLLFKTRYRVVAWGAMQFLKKSLEQTTRRIRFQELLLLLLRIFLLVLLAFALMRPSSRAHTNHDGAPVDAIFIMDVSGSMAVQEGSRSRLNEAKDAALGLLESLPAQSTVRILSLSQSVRDLGPPSSTNRDQARFVIAQLEQTHEATNLLPALLQARELLSRGALANKEVYLFSDMQRSGWSREGAALQAVWSELQELGEVILVPVGKGTIPTNACLMQMRPQVAMPMPGERVPFIVEVRNTGVDELQGVTVTLRCKENERDSDTQMIPRLKPGESAALTLTTRLERRGKNLVVAELQGDQLTIDNRLDYLIETRDNLKVLIVDSQWNEADPSKSASYFLAHALRSTRDHRLTAEADHLQMTVVSASSAYGTLLSDAQVCFLVGLAGAETHQQLSQEFLERLTSFVKAGGGLVVFAGPMVSGSSRIIPEFPVKYGAPITQSPNQPLTFDIKSIPVGSFLSAFRYPPLDRLAQVETTSTAQLEPVTKTSQIVLRFSDGSPAVIVDQSGQGSVVVVSTSADLQGTDAPLRPQYVPWIGSMIGHILTKQRGRKNLIAGETYFWSAPPGAVHQRYHLMPPQGGAPRPLGMPKIVEDRPLLSTSDTAQAGIYRVAATTSGLEETGAESMEGDVFTIAHEPSETNELTILTEAQVKEHFKQSPIYLAANEIAGSTIDRSRVQREWTDSIFWVLIVFCLGELAFSWFCNRAI